MLYSNFFTLILSVYATCIEGLRYLYRLLTRQVTYVYAISRVYQHDKKWDFHPPIHRVKSLFHLIVYIYRL